MNRRRFLALLPRALFSVALLLAIPDFSMPAPHGENFAVVTVVRVIFALALVHGVYRMWRLNEPT